MKVDLSRFSKELQRLQPFFWCWLAFGLLFVQCRQQPKEGELRLEAYNNERKVETFGEAPRQSDSAELADASGQDVEPVEQKPKDSMGASHSTKRLETFFAKYGGKSAFTRHYVDALTAFLTIEELYFAGKYQEAKKKLDAIWSKYPKGNRMWYQAKSSAYGTNVGNPVGYYGLRMLEEMLRFRLKAKVPSNPATAVMTIVLVDCVKGIQPTTKAELEAGKGKAVTLKLQQKLFEQQSLVITQSTRLFREYIFAMTDGKLKVKLELLPLKVCATGIVRTKPYRVIGLRSVGELWPHIPDAIKRKTSWWWVIYPSLVPEQYPDFTTTEFITGGMGIGPTQDSPCFIVDDKWLLRKPPHLGKGPYSELERRAYLPQWLQHEFFHHLFRIYPEFGLEKTSHQWFDRSTWPKDFQGSFEPDYYAEALQKRLQLSQAKPPMYIKLRYEAPPVSLYEKVQEKDFLGSYQRRPVTNNWHEGTIQKAQNGYLWRNKAGVSWGLTLNKKSGGLDTGPKCPYRNSPGGRIFQWSFARGADGNYQTAVTGFFFNGEIYHKVP